MPKSRRGKAKIRRISSTIQGQPNQTSNLSLQSAGSTIRHTAATSQIRLDYLPKDIKLIGIIAGSMIALLVLISFIIAR
jgi:hypothetical protein